MLYAQAVIAGITFMIIGTARNAAVQAVQAVREAEIIRSVLIVIKRTLLQLPAVQDVEKALQMVAIRI